MSESDLSIPNQVSNGAESNDAELPTVSHDVGGDASSGVLGEVTTEESHSVSDTTGQVDVAELRAETSNNVDISQQVVEKDDNPLNVTCSYFGIRLCIITCVFYETITL